MEHVIETLDIGPLLDKPVRKLSLGQRMRCELAAALIHNPPLLFLDEPTIGLDVLVKLRIREFLKEINQKYNTTILLTTHDLSDIEALCERVVMLDEGKIIYDGSLVDLRSNWGDRKQIQFQFVYPTNLVQLEKLTTDLAVDWQKGEQGNSWIANVSNQDDTVSTIITRVVANNQISDMKIDEISTEEIVRNIYEQGIKVRI
jgi:ABC-2 type transport system ATP-binding protein